MKKTVAILSTIAMLVMMVGATAVFAQDKGPASINLDFNSKGKKVNNFEHHKHQGHMKCNECHHKNHEGETPKACHSCHHKKKGDAPAIKDAYHKNCKGCHKKGKKGPTKCNDCHKR